MMRTTLSLDEDVAKRLERLQRQRKTSWRALVNEVLRRGLSNLESRPKPLRRPYRTHPVSAGRLLVPSLDDVATALEIAEGERHR
jgi:hypothetical protein